MTKSQLIKWSAARDALNFLIIGQIPGVSQVLDLPIIVMHFNYAGVGAVFTLFELIPFVGIFPFFTVSAMLYPNRDTAPKAIAGRHDALDGDSAHSTPPQLYAFIDGELVPVDVPDNESSGPRVGRHLPGH